MMAKVPTFQPPITPAYVGPPMIPSKPAKPLPKGKKTKKKAAKPKKQSKPAPSRFAKVFD